MLLDFQRAFASALNPAAIAAMHVIQSGTAERLNLGLRVYRNNHAHARVEALQKAYPAVLRLVGDDCFTALALDMAARAPMASAVAEDWTAQLPAFLAETPLAGTLPYLADVARIEAAWLRAYGTADPSPDAAPPPDNPEILSRCRLRLSSGATVVRSVYPAYAIWEAQRKSIGFDGNGPADCVVYRSALAVEVEPIESAAAAALDCLRMPVAAADWLVGIAGETATLMLAGRLLTAGAIIAIEGQDLDDR